MKTWQVTVEKVVEFVTYVDAETPAEARSKAESGEYDECVGATDEVDRSYTDILLYAVDDVPVAEMPKAKVDAVLAELGLNGTDLA